MMSAKRVIFVRTGETGWNVEERWQGWLDVPLNEHGRQQVERVAYLMRNIGLGALYSSDLRRAVDTADVIGRHAEVKPVLDQRLRERNIGRWQGLKLSEVREWFPDEYAAYTADRLRFRIPDGESLLEVQVRMRAAFDDYVAKDGGESICVVSHTVSIRVLLMTLIDGFDADAVRLGNSSVTTIVRNGDGWRIVVPNDITHLEGLESRSVNEMEDHAK
jgi:broad specificity phosphatase PhoE